MIAMLHHQMIVYLSHFIISGSTTLHYIKFWVGPDKLESDNNPMNYNAVFKSCPENNYHCITAADPGFQMTLLKQFHQRITINIWPESLAKRHRREQTKDKP